MSVPLSPVVAVAEEEERKGGKRGRRLVVLTAEGHCYQYAVDVREGGTCRLVDEKTMLQEETGSQALAQRFLSG